MLHKFLLYTALATAGPVLAAPAAAQSEKGQITAGRQEPNKKQTIAASGDTQPVNASSESANTNPSVPGTRAKVKKKDKNKAKPANSEQEEEFNRMLLGIHG